MKNKNFSTKQTLGIYVHIPFCVQKCRYCDFCSLPGSSAALQQQYMNALKKDILQTGKLYSDMTVDTVYFGGGTPTCVSSDLLVDTVKTIKNAFCVSYDSEITIECNPATADESSFLRLLNGGFNRLSMGLQSIHDKELQALGRIHSLSDFENTFFAARRAGFGNINIDLMYGIPLQTENSFEQTLQAVIAYKPEHISAYALKIEPGTDFYKKKETLLLPDEDCEYNMYRRMADFLPKQSYGHYEISNYARSGKESKHNLKYWSLDSYIGFGTAAHSLIGYTRYVAVPSVASYISGISEETESRHTVYQIEETLDDKALCEEYIMMRLRLSQGLSPSAFLEKFGYPLPEKYVRRIQPFLNTEYMSWENGAYALSDSGMYVSNYILTELLDLD